MVELHFTRSNKVLIAMLIFCILISGFIIGFVISGRMVQSNWELFYSDVKVHYERDCTCIERDPYGLQRPNDWRDQVWATLDINNISVGIKD